MIEHSKDEHNLTLVNEDKNLLIRADWQGCVHIENWSNGETIDSTYLDERDYIHICDLDTFIQQLQEVSEKRKNHWPHYFTEQ